MLMESTTACSCSQEFGRSYLHWQSIESVHPCLSRMLLIVKSPRYFRHKVFLFLLDRTGTNDVFSLLRDFESTLPGRKRIGSTEIYCV